MAINKVVEGLTYAAEGAVDHSSNLHKIATINSSEKVALCGDGAIPLGVLTEVDIADRPVTVQFGGIAKVLLGGTVNAGGVVASGAAGTGVAAAVNDFGLGIALRGGVSGDIIPVALTYATRGV